MTARKPTLDDLVREAREERVPDVDWAKMEEPLFARVAAEARAQAAIAQYEGKRRTWVAGAMVLAVAAAVPLVFAGRDKGVTLDVTSRAGEPGAGELSWKDPSAVVHLTRGGVAHDAASGEALARGDVVEPKSGRVVFARATPGAVTWDVEENARVEVRSTRGALILALERGAVEAQVASVADGEAFAVDVEGTRVAVHGTHLRVSREGARATVDLREGVISIGLPPREGSTYGDLITAPAHVEFDASDPHGTLKVNHEEWRVRQPSVLERPREAASGREAHTDLPRVVPTLPRPAPPNAPGMFATRASTVPSSPVVPPPPLAPLHTSEPVNAPVPPPPTPPRVDANPERTIADAVRACESSHVAAATGVVVTVSSTLQLHVAESGMVESALFDPPLAPDVQQCAVHAIYGTRFARGGAVSVPIDFTP